MYWLVMRINGTCYDFPWSVCTLVDVSVFTLSVVVSILVLASVLLLLVGLPPSGSSLSSTPLSSSAAISNIMFSALGFVNPSSDEATEVSME